MGNWSHTDNGSCQNKGFPDSAAVALELCEFAILAFSVMYLVTSKKTVGKSARHTKMTRQPRRDKPFRSSAASRVQNAEAPKTLCMDATPLQKEFQDFLSRSLPTPEDEHMARQLGRMIYESISCIAPEAEINAIPRENLVRMAATGGKPEVDVIVTMHPEVLAHRLTQHFVRIQCSRSFGTLMPDTIRKTAVRVLSESIDFVKFWRSQFTGCDPTVVLLVPKEVGVADFPIRLNFFVNSPCPIRLEALMLKSDVHTKELIVLVTRWAVLRGIAHASKGHLHMYGWALLAVHFIKNLDGGKSFARRATLDMFADFVSFYGAWFKRGAKVVTVRFTSRSREQRQRKPCWDLPYIEDPFEPASDVATTMNTFGVARLQEELARAALLLEGRHDSSWSLEHVLARWTPPERQASPAEANS